MFGAFFLSAQSTELSAFTNGHSGVPFIVQSYTSEQSGVSFNGQSAFVTFAD
ncbi:MAG: hypothetical protein M3413_08930 [Bacteroidota bacterium]|nr:hypothetical protein [Bacteroidota bacterium]